jgi:Family of unknown function (DUF5681)
MDEGTDKNNQSKLNSNITEPDTIAQENLSNQTREMVGYKKPPTHSRFKPGQSGNRRGRPKGAFTAKALFRKVMNEKLTITENGRLRKLPSAELVFMALRNKALKGDHKAQQTMFEFMEKWELDDQKNQGGVFTIRFIDDKLNVDEPEIVKKYTDISEIK